MAYEEIERDLDRRARWRERTPEVIPAVILSWLFGDPEAERATHREQRETVKQQFDETIPELHATLENVREAVTPAIDNGTPLPTDEYVTRLEQAREHANMVAENLNTDYLREAEVDELEALRGDLRELHETVAAKQAFDTHVALIDTQVEQLQEKLAPYRAYDEYLSRDVATAIRDNLDAIASQLNTLTAEVAMERLPEADRTRVHDLETWVSETRTFLDDYNERFVEQEIHAHDDLFTDIDAGGHDLTLAQRRAIVRNDARSQVIAAAGTGKTFVLTYRIAYLVEKQGVDPTRIVALTFTNEATAEMAARLEREFGITDVDFDARSIYG